MSTIQIRIDEKTKKAVQKVLKKADLDLSTVIRYFLRDIAEENQIPRITTVNAMTWEKEMQILKASEEAKEGRNIEGPFRGQSITDHLNTLKWKSTSTKNSKKAIKNSRKNFRRKQTTP